MQAEQFAAHARVEEHHWWFVARRRILRRLVARISDPGAPIADIGCGTGGNAAAFARAGHPVLGLDPSADAIRFATARYPAVRFAVSDDPGSARDHLASGGVALLTDVLEHVADDHALLSATVNALPLGGHLVLTVPADATLWGPHDVAFGHHRRYEAGSLAALLATVPATVRLLTPFNARLRPLIAWVRRRAPGGVRPGGDLDVPSGPLNRIFQAAFAGEADRLVGALDGGRPAYRRGVSLLAVLRRR